MKTLFSLLFILIVIKTYAQNTWELINPLPTYQDGKDIHFISDNVGYILVSNQILQTIDSGENWTVKMNIESANDFSFMNNLGYIVGINGYVLKSQDFGDNWQIVNIGTNEDLENVYVISQDNVIITSENKIHRTLDGGETWTQTDFPEMFNVYKTYFIDNSIGFIINEESEGTIWKTIDGGNNWHQVYQGYPYIDNNADIYFLDNNLGFAFVPDPTQGWINNLLKTVDGGESWSLVFQTQDDETWGSFTFINESIGYLSTPTSVFLKTTNSGDDWEYVYPEASQGSDQITKLFFTNENLGYATGPVGRIYKTIDGGLNWTRNSPSYNNSISIDFVSDSIAYFNRTDLISYPPPVISQNPFSQLFKYNSNNDSIEEIIIQSPEHFNDYTYSRCQYPEENVLYCFREVQNKLFKSVDGGHNWAITNYPYNNTMYQMTFIDENVGFISFGSNNSTKLVRTVDGGDTWAFINTPENIRLQNFKFFNSNFGYISCSNSDYNLHQLYKTTDGGNSWELLIEYEGYSLIAGVSSPEPEVIYFLSGEPESEFQFVSIDGGATWNNILFPENFNPTNSYILSLSNGLLFALIENHKIYMSTNYAMTWEYLSELDLPVNISIDSSILLLYKNNYMYFYSYNDSGVFMKIYFDGDLGIIDSAESETNFIIFPNPVNNRLNIKSKDGKNINSISLLDNTGKIIIKNNKINQSEYVLDIKNLSKGIYHIIINSKESKKIIKK